MAARERIPFAIVPLKSTVQTKQARGGLQKSSSTRAHKAAAFRNLPIPWISAAKDNLLAFQKADFYFVYVFQMYNHLNASSLIDQVENLLYSNLTGPRKAKQCCLLTHAN